MTSQLDVSVVRLKTHGHRFEVGVRREPMLAYVEAGRDLPPTNLETILLDPSIFSNVHRRQSATRATLREAFGDLGAIGSPAWSEALTTILQFGEVVEDEAARAQKRKALHEIKSSITDRIFERLLSKWTGCPLSKDEFDPVFEKHKEALHPLALNPTPNVEPLYLVIHSVVQLCRLDGDLRRRALRSSLNSISKRELLHVEKFNKERPELFSLLSVTNGPPAASPGGGGAPAGEGGQEGAQQQHQNRVSVELLFDPELATGLRGLWKTKTGLDFPPAPYNEVQDMELLVPFSTMELAPPEADSPSGAEDSDLNKRIAALEEMKAKGGQSRVDDEAQQHRKKKGGGDWDKAKSSGASIELEEKYSALTLKRLQEICKKNGLSTGGKKEALVDRLVTYDETTKPSSSTSEGKKKR